MYIKDIKRELNKFFEFRFTCLISFGFKGLMPKLTRSIELMNIFHIRYVRIICYNAPA